MDNLDQSPFFSVVMVDYEHHVPRDRFRRGVQCFGEQSFQSFELLIFHDGPKEMPYEEELSAVSKPEFLRTFATEARENVWGHTNRDRGIRAARGEWIVHTNADNVFYPDALERLAAKIHDASPVVQEQTVTTEKQVVIFPILMRGMAPVRSTLAKCPEYEEEMTFILSGIPVRINHIDAMQFVTRRDIWLAEGGWYDTSFAADGVLYERLAQKYSIAAMTEVLGEHW
ncbi:MAG: glycosyltransferase [Hyphomicrobiales bacterium]